MNENFLNLLAKTLASNARTSLTNPDLKSQVLTKTIAQLNKTQQPASDSISQSSTAEELLISYQLPIEEENLNIANSFLNKGVSPSKEEIEKIKLILQNLPENADVTKSLEKSVKSTLLGLDLTNENIQDSVSGKFDKETVQKLFQDLKIAVINDKSIPAKVRVEVSNEIDQIQKEIEQNTTVKESSRIPNSEEAIVEKLKVAASQAPEKENQNIEAIASKGLEKINTIIEDGVSEQIQKDEVLQNTNDLYENIEQLKNKLTSDRKDLISKIDNTAAEFTEAKKSILENVQKIIELQKSKDSSVDQSVLNTFQEKIPVFLKSLNSSDEILAKFGEYVSSFPQSQKPVAKTVVNPEVPVSNNLVNNTGEESMKDILSSIGNSTVDESEEVVFNEKTSSKNFASLTNNPTFKLLYQVSNIAESLQDNLQAIKKIINQTADLPPSVSLKELAKLFQEDYPQFFKAFDKLNLASNEFPEFQKIQKSLLADSLKESIFTELGNENEILNSSGKIKTINLEQLKDELERIEIEHFKSSETISSLKKVHESVSKTEAKLTIHRFLETPSIKPESFQTFELNINPLQENRLARVEVQHNRKAEESKIKSSFSINIEVDLTQTGEIKARLFSDENAKQIFLNFADNDFKEIAIDNQEELQTQLREIPFITQLYFGNINKPAPIDSNSARQDNNNLIGTHKFDSLA